ncbi:MAG: hypothetical protein WBB65_00810 [Anaerolineales bacterium]
MAQSTEKRNFQHEKNLLFLCHPQRCTLACGQSLTASPTNPVSVPPNTTTPSTPIPLNTTIPMTPSPSVNSPPGDGTELTYGLLTLVLPREVASGASSSEVAPTDGEESPFWQKTPGHLQVILGDYYVLQGKFHLPQISIFPAQAYAEMVPAAFEAIRSVNNIIYSPDPAITADQLPVVPFFNATQVFASNIRMISFQNGGGVRYLTQYAQYPAPVNNHELFYHFQGVTRDGAYYITAIFPISIPLLAETSESGAALPIGGVAYPDLNDPNVDLEGYYTAVADLLNAASMDAFTPALSQLDQLIQSIWVAP